MNFNENVHVVLDGVLFVRKCKNDGVLFRRGTICPHVQKLQGYYFAGVLFVRMCKNDGVLFRRGTICPASVLVSTEQFIDQYRLFVTVTIIQISVTTVK